MENNNCRIFSVLQEMHFGKITQLLELEDLFDKLGIKYKNMNINTNDSAYRLLIKDPILKTIGSKISNIFGFRETVLTFVQDQELNAYTLPYAYTNKGNAFDDNDNFIKFHDMQKALVVTTRGMKFDKTKFPITFFICLNTGCVINSELSPSELIAVLLHEIGHSFSKVVLNSKELKPIRADEKFADQFVVMYGYGPELISAFSKMTIDYSKFEKKLVKIPVLNLFVGLKKIAFDFGYRNLMDMEHPPMITRMKSVIASLESDLKHTPNLSIETRKDILNQIKDCKLKIEKFYNGTEQDNMATKMIKSYSYNYQERFSNEKKLEKQAKYSDPNYVNRKVDKLYRRGER